MKTKTRGCCGIVGGWFVLLFLVMLFFPQGPVRGATVHVSRFWHNHQPLYWPEWNSNGDQTSRGQYAWDSIVLKPGQNYGGISPAYHPENDLSAIFSVNDRIAAYQDRPRASVSKVANTAGFAMSYSGSLIDNVRQLGGGGHLGYSGYWNSGNTEARKWTTPSGGPRLDMVGFTYHHSLAPLLPKSVFRKEVQIFKQAWWKAWDGNSDLSDHSKGFFPTEMAYTRDLIDVLVDEGYEWIIVASHHISRTCPTYLDQADPEGSYNIFSSPPNKADLLGPSPTSGWWFDQPNPGNAAWNVSPYGYQLHKVKYVNPETGEEKTMVAVPSDDVLSYQAGYSGAQVGKISGSIAPYATDPNNPVMVLPSTDGDNAWGGGYTSWEESTPGFFGDCQNNGYQTTTIQDFVNQYGNNAGVAHIEDGAWIFPESCYGSSYFLKWIEPPLYNLAAGATNRYPGTKVDMETPGFALKFFSYAPLMAGANWCETAEQILVDEGGSVQAWKIQSPYDWDGVWTSPNDVELAWHIYLMGLDSGFNYYGGLGNDDEDKPALATRRAIDKLQSFMSTRMDQDRTGPTALKPQRFPYNPGAYTFGWFNPIPGGDTRYLKKMPSEFYIWSHVYDLSGVQSVNLKIRRDKDGVRSLSNNDNVTYAGGGDVESWVSIPMTKRVLPNTRTALNAAADNGQIDYFVFDPAFWAEPVIADYYFVRIDNDSLPGFRGNLFDYYIETTDELGNVTKTEIQHVWVEDDGISPSSSVTFSDDPNNCSPLTVTYHAEGGPLEGFSPVYMQINFTGTTWNLYQMSSVSPDVWSYTIQNVPSNSTEAEVWFQNVSGGTVDSRNGLNWSTSIRDCNAPVGPSTAVVDPVSPSDCNPITIKYYPNEGPLQGAAAIYIHVGHDGFADTVLPNPIMTKNGYYWQYVYTPPLGIEMLDFCFNDGTTWDNQDGLDWHIAVTNCFGPVPDGIVITNPPSNLEVAFIQSNYMVRGTAKIVVGDLAWTNALTGDAGTLDAVSAWTIPALPLGTGANLITVKGSGAAASGVTTNAQDDGSESAYDAVWADDSNGGTGFSPWVFYRTVEDNSQAGWFTRNNILGARSWAMYANSGQMAEAKRPFASAMQTGQTFCVKMRNGWISTGAGVGIALQNEGGDTLWQFWFNGGDTNYNITSGTTDIGWTGDGLEIEFTLTGTSTFSAEITPYGGAARTYAGNLEDVADKNITLFRAWNNFAGTGEEYDYYINDLRITTPESGEAEAYSDSVTITRAAGTDSNGDGIPDAWYEQNGFTPSGPSIADEDTDGDTLSNREEYRLGTNPRDAASALCMDRIGPLAGAGVPVRWQSVGGRQYRIEYSDDLTAGFVPLITVTESAPYGTATNRTYNDASAANRSNRYYRVLYIGE
ncbi:MAG: carbohydrate-binding protein [Kiritimatiellae bacterium]|nr:carbohydrate-binding protein [Kiritimatiellia bacterium]